MARVQIRDLPEETCRVYRARAAAGGMSLQEYLRAELIAGARVRSPAEIGAEVEEDLRAGGAGFATRSAARLVAADRARH